MPSSEVFRHYSSYASFIETERGLRKLLGHAFAIKYEDTPVEVLTKGRRLDEVLLNLQLSNSLLKRKDCVVAIPMFPESGTIRVFLITPSEFRQLTSKNFKQYFL